MDSLFKFNIYLNKFFFLSLISFVSSLSFLSCLGFNYCFFAYVFACNVFLFSSNDFVHYSF